MVFRILVAGIPKSGKTSILASFIDIPKNQFDAGTWRTSFNVDGMNCSFEFVELDLSDESPASEPPSLLETAFIKQAHGIVHVIDCTNATSLQTASSLMTRALDIHKADDFPTVAILTKRDLPAVVLSREKVTSHFSKLDLPLFFTPNPTEDTISTASTSTTSSTILDPFSSEFDIKNKDYKELSRQVFEKLFSLIMQKHRATRARESEKRKKRRRRTQNSSRSNVSNSTCSLM